MSDHDSAETESSICEEERLRRLFYLCDENGDGFIDSHDLLSMCKQLEMENAFEQILADLGGNQDGLISLEDFVRRGLNVHACHDFSSTVAVAEKRRAFETNVSLSNQLSDVEEFDSGFLVTSGASNSIPTSCESLSNGQKVESWKRDLPTSAGTGGGTTNMRSLPTSGDNSRTNSFGRQKSSGGRSPQISGPPGSFNPKSLCSKNLPHIHQNTSPRLGGGGRLLNELPLGDFSGGRSALGGPRNSAAVMFLNSYGQHHEHPPGSPKGIIQNAAEQNINNLHLAALASMRQDIIDLNCKLQTLVEEKDSLEKELIGVQREKDLLDKECQRKLESQSMRYEERITELHGVIFEINKQYDRLHGDTIREEDEEEFEENEIEEEGEDEQTSHSNSSTSLAVQKHRPSNSSNSFLPSYNSTTVQSHSQQNQYQRVFSSAAVTGNNACSLLKQAIAKAENKVNQNISEQHSIAVPSSTGSTAENNNTTNLLTVDMTNKRGGATPLSGLGARSSAVAKLASLEYVKQGGAETVEVEGVVEDQGDPYTVEVDALDTIPTCSTSVGVKHAPDDNASTSKDRTSSFNANDVGITETPPNGLSCAHPPRRYHDLEVLSADFDLVGGCDAEHNSCSDGDDDDVRNDDSFGDCDVSEDDEETGNNKRNCKNEEEGQNLYYELNADAEAVDNDAVACAEMLDKVPLPTSVETTKAMTSPSKTRVPLIGRRRTAASANMSASMANLLEDDSVILDLERQTAMACKELETLEISNTSRGVTKISLNPGGQLKVITPHSPYGASSPGINEGNSRQKRMLATSVPAQGQSMTSPSPGQITVPKLTEQLRIQERSISDLEVQLTMCKKENNNLQYLLSMGSQEKQKMMNRISELEQNLSQLLLAGAAVDNGAGGVFANSVPNNVHPSNGCFDVNFSTAKNDEVMAGSFGQLGKFGSKTLPKSSTCKGYDYKSCNDLPLTVDFKDGGVGIIKNTPTLTASNAASLVPPPLPPPRMASLDSSQGKGCNNTTTLTVASSSSSLHGNKSASAAANATKPETALLPPGATAAGTTTSSVQSLLHLKSSSDGGTTTAGGPDPSPQQPDELQHLSIGEVTADRIIGLELQLEKSDSKVGRLQSEVDLLQLTLEESKSTSERLAMLCGKYESNNTALRMTMDYADLCIEALESLMALASTAYDPRTTGPPNAINNNNLSCNILGEASDYEDEYGMLGLGISAAAALHQVAGSTCTTKEEQHQLMMDRQRRQQNRRHAEAVAKAILSHLDSTLARVNRVVTCSQALDKENPSSASSVKSNNSARSNNQYCNNGGAPIKNAAVSGSGAGSGGSRSSPNVFAAAGDDWSSQGRTSTTSSTNSATSAESDWSKLDENRLKDYIAQLKSERAAVRLTIMELESIYADPDVSSQMKVRRHKQISSSSNGNSPQNSNQSSLKVSSSPQRDKWREESEDMLAAFETQRQDLEYAVLTQELMTLKEEKAELRAQMYLTEKEKKQMACMQSSQESQLKAYALQIEQLKEQLEGKRLLGGQFIHAGAAGEGGGLHGHNSSLQELSSKSVAMNHQTSLSGFSTLSSTASCAKSDPLCGSEHNSSCPSAAGGGVVMTSQLQPPPTATPIITLEQLSSVAAGGVSHHISSAVGGGAVGDPTRGQGSAAGESGSVEARRKEQKMKQRIQELSNALETLSKHCDAKDKQTSEYIADLKRANSALIAAYDKAKKKHSSRLKKLEAQMKAMCERHDTTVKMLKQRISLLEEQEKKSTTPTTVVSATSKLSAPSSQNSSTGRGVVPPSETCL